MSYADEIHEQVTGIIAREVERQIRVFLQSARGVDWTAKLEQALRENIRLKQAIQDIAAQLPRGQANTPRAKAVVDILRQVSDIVEIK